MFQVMIGRFVGLENDGKTLFFCSKGMDFHLCDVQLLGGVDWVDGWVGIYSLGETPPRFAQKVQ